MWISLASEDDGDPAVREPSEDEVVSGGGSCRVQLRGVLVGESYAIRVRVWTECGVSHWSSRLVVTTTAPRIPQLPAMDVCVDVGNLTWSSPLKIDAQDGYCPSVLALDGDRIVVTWLRPGLNTNHIRCVCVSDGRMGPIVETGLGNDPHEIHERRLSPLSPSSCVMVERKKRDRPVLCRRACVSDLVVTLDSAVELGGVSWSASDVYRLDCGVYVASGRGLGGDDSRAGLCVFRIDVDGTVSVVCRESVGVATDALSVLVSRSQNRVCVAHKGGVSVVSVGVDGRVSECASLPVDGYCDYWYWGIGVDLGGGRVVQMYCTSHQSSLVVVDVGGGSRSAGVLGIVSKHEASRNWSHRACTVGEYLVLPGGNAPVDMVCVSAANPREWSHVRRYTIQDIRCHAYPCVVGGKIVLVYVSTTSLPPPYMCWSVISTSTLHIPPFSFPHSTPSLTGTVKHTYSDWPGRGWWQLRNRSSRGC